MKRLLLITPDYTPKRGGVARYLSNMVATLPNMHVITDVPQDVLDERVSEVKLSWKLWPRWIPAITELLKRKKQTDLVLTSHVLPFGTAALVAKWLGGNPYAVFVPGMDIRLTNRSARKRWLAKLVLKHAQGVFANSQALANEVSERFGIEAAVIYPALQQVETNQAAHNNKLLTVSRLVKRKGHERVLRTLAALKQEGISPQYHIIGDGPEREAIEQLIDTLGVRENVTLHGALTDREIQEHYANATAFVMPAVHDMNDKEGFGMVYLEAAQHGVPSIATNMPGVDEAVLHNKTGLLVDDDDHENLKIAIRQLLTDQVLRDALGQAAQTRTGEHSPHRSSSDNLMTCYEPDFRHHPNL